MAGGAPGAPAPPTALEPGPEPATTLRRLMEAKAARERTAKRVNVTLIMAKTSCERVCSFEKGASLFCPHADRQLWPFNLIVCDEIEKNI